MTRLQGLMSVAARPGFRFSIDDTIMTIGSCFARELELYLHARGFDVPSLSVNIPENERLPGTKPNVILNKYSVHSMANELRWAFTELPCAPETFYLQAGDDLWHDAHLVHNLLPASMERVQERRRAVMEMTAQLGNCRVIVITLGLVECWFDREADLYLNGIPPKFALTTQPDRFELRVLDYADVLDTLTEIHTLINQYGHPQAKILLTVSPVPFKSSMTGQDAVTANTYGKSVQRAAAEVFAATHENVDYFPSYEIVALSPRNLAYELDNIHVTPAAVDLIMTTVLDAYCDPLPDSRASTT